MQKDHELILDATSNPGIFNSQCSCAECDTDSCFIKRLDKACSCSRSENFHHLKNNKYTTKVYMTKIPQGKQNIMGNEKEGYDVIKEVQEIVYGINKHNKPKIIRETSTKIMKLKTCNPSSYNTRESKNVKSSIHSFPTVGNIEKSPSSKNVSCHKNKDKKGKNYNDYIKEIANGIISSILSFPIKDLPDKVKKDNLLCIQTNIEAFHSISESKKSNAKHLCNDPLFEQGMNQKPKRKDSFRKDATATALTAEVMNLPYKDFQTSISRPIVSSGKPHLSALDIINKIKEAYEACSCRVCECIVGKPLQNELCSCKPCECNYCANISKCMLSNTGSKLIPKYNESYLYNRCSNIESSSFGRMGQIDLDNNRIHDPNSVRFTKNSGFCDCEPCQCLEFTARPINRTFKVASLGGELQYRGGCQCSSCECFECTHSLGASSFGQHKISTSFNRHNSYHHDMLVNEACIPNGSQNWRESQSKVLYKPIDQDSHDFDRSTENVAYNKRRMCSDNFETVTMFAALPNTCQNKHGRQCECDQCECLEGKRDQYSSRSLIQEGFFNSYDNDRYDNNNIAPFQKHKGQTCIDDGIYCKTYKNAIHNKKTQSPHFNTINQKSSRNALSSENIEANVKESQHLQNNFCKSQNFAVQFIGSSKEKQITQTSDKENHDHYQSIFETGSVCGSQTNNNAESTFEEEFKKVQDILKETLEFIKRLVQLVNKYENATKEIKRGPENTHNANYSLNDKVKILKFVNSKSNLKDTFDTHEVPTKYSKIASKSLTNELFTYVKDIENLRALSLEKITNTGNSCTFRNATLEHNIKRRNECNKDYIKSNNIILNTITENNDSMDIVHKHNLVTVNKLNRRYNQTYKRSRKLTEESKNLYNTSFTEININEDKTKQIFKDHESFQETQNKKSSCMAFLHDRKSIGINIDGDFYNGYLPKIAESTNLLRLVTKSTTEIVNLNNSVIENNTSRNDLVQIKEAVMIKQPMEEQNEGTAVVKARSDEPLIFKKNLDIKISTESIRSMVQLPTSCERDVKAVSEMIEKQAPDENASYIYDRISNTYLNAQNTLNCEALKVIGLNARRVSHHSVLVKWKAPRSLDNVEGYEVLVDGCSVQKILNPFHRMAVISCLPHTDKLLLTVRTVTDETDHYPATTLVYHTRKQH